MRSLRQKFGRMGRLALALGVLGGLLLLGAILSPWTWRPSAVEPPPLPSRARALTQEAQHALLAGNLSQARQQLEEALAQDPRHAPALLMQACLALEAADTQTAKTALASLPGLALARLEPQLVHRMVELRALSYPSMVAYRVALWSNTHGAAYLLAKRAEVTHRQLVPGARHRLGRILWNIGSRLSEQSTVLEHLVGLQLMEQGAADLGNEGERERVARLLEAAKALRNASDMAVLERWPLPSLWEEVAEARGRDEWAHCREFASMCPKCDRPAGN